MSWNRHCGGAVAAAPFVQSANRGPAQHETRPKEHYNRITDVIYFIELMVSRIPQLAGHLRTPVLYRPSDGHMLHEPCGHAPCGRPPGGVSPRFGSRRQAPPPQQACIQRSACGPELQRSGWASYTASRAPDGADASTCTRKGARGRVSVWSLVALSSDCIVQASSAAMLVWRCGPPRPACACQAPQILESEAVVHRSRLMRGRAAQSTAYCAAAGRSWAAAAAAAAARCTRAPGPMSRSLPGAAPVHLRPTLVELQGVLTEVRPPLVKRLRMPGICGERERESVCVCVCVCWLVGCWWGGGEQGGMWGRSHFPLPPRAGAPARRWCRRC